MNKRERLLAYIISTGRDHYPPDGCKNKRIYMECKASDYCPECEEHGLCDSFSAYNSPYFSKKKVDEFSEKYPEYLL